MNDSPTQDKSITILERMPPFSSRYGTALAMGMSYSFESFLISSLSRSLTSPAWASSWVCCCFVLGGWVLHCKNIQVSSQGHGNTNPLHTILLTTRRKDMETSLSVVLLRLGWVGPSLQKHTSTQPRPWQCQPFTYHRSYNKKDMEA